MIKCPHCGSEHRQRKVGRTKAGSQRYECAHCERKYTPEPKAEGYSAAIRFQAVELYTDGLEYRRIGRLLGVSPQSVINWCSAYARLPAQTSVPQEVLAHGSAMLEPLLTPKFQPPRLHSSVLRRSRLLAQLEAGHEGKLILISAPAGFGKTTLVRQWLDEVAQRDTAPTVAWLSLDRNDNDPLRFCRYLITACQVFGNAVGLQSLALLEPPIAIRSPLEMILTAFVNELAQTAGKCVLVLEDYHVINTLVIHEALTFLLDHLPPHMQLLMITRTNVPLPLARMRAAGELTEIEAPDLRFSDAETTAFLQQLTTLALPPAELAQVVSRIEGWAAGLRLIMLALQGHQDPNSLRLVLANFVAGRRGIGDYFVAEVLLHQPAPVQQFLLQTSFLSNLTALLCDRVTERSDSQALLERLEQANLFVEGLDGSGLWYRYHTLFAAAMQAEAKRQLGEASVRALLERAGSWYEAHDMLGEAIDSAFAADNLIRAADLIEVVARPLLSLEQPDMHGPPEYYSLQVWLARLPQAMLDQRPLLNMALAIATIFTLIVDMRPMSSSVFSEVEQLLLKAEHGLRAVGETGRLSQLYAFRALLFRERGEIVTAVGWARAALELLPPAELNWRSICISTLGLDEETFGHLDRAAQQFAAARALCEALGNRAFARANGSLLAWVYLEKNELHRAAVLFRQILSEARAVGDLDDVGHILHGLAEIALSWNDLDAAWTAATEVVEITQAHPHESSYVDAMLILARVEHLRGQSDAAQGRCATLLADRAPAVLPADRQLNAAIEFEQARLALAAGDLAPAQRWRASPNADRARLRPAFEREETLLARLFMAEGNPGRAVRLLEGLLLEVEKKGHERIALEIHVLLASAYTACGQVANAQHSLTAALMKAYPATARRVFIDGGQPLVALLRTTLTSLDDKNLVVFAKTILRDSAPHDAAASAELLSQQERRVLRLIAAGHSNADIATTLVVSVNTVKAHVKNIYRKLKVSSRLEAANAARNIGLL